MKNLFRFASAVSLILGMQVAAVSTAFAGTEAGIADFIDDYCKPAVDSGAYGSVGECMGDSRQDLMDYCRANYQALGFKTNGLCQKWAQDHIQNKNYAY